MVNKKLRQEIKTYNIVALSFARGIGSTHKRRCLWNLCGKSILQWSFEIVRDSEYIDEIVLGTEDLEIAQFAEKIGMTVIMRPLEDALDFPIDYARGIHKRIKPRSLTHGELTSWPRRHHYLLYCLREQKSCIPDLVFGWTPNMPLATTETVNKVIEAFFRDPEASCSRSAYAVDPKFFTINPVTQRLFPVFIDLPQSLDRQLYPPAFRIGPFNLEGLPLKGKGKLTHVIIDREEGIRIHSKKDLDYAGYLMEKRLKGGEKK